ncbi:MULTISPECIES: nitrate reductase molybdenum cofactor assembly chaperone [Lysinibacillus]|uniref:Nitrate reductase molybdenum cofactor assembly chaperone n=1 Tax=Lysinibacillus antri TaxID=2498145 RepID=A0A3S0P5C1_9BACI|nr:MULTISPECIES: nitrate reductase molybdenum cofactor assembly chaperone [Lysinibacillus]RUL51624.1 nitrate reductase molybdenum cofactor assembly chaperone [Lysinibacillus antri]TSI10665.1 nitrate reductase molybdenum cofactor assembly chaperone [Lysinibacillus sp. BW-2-10]
MIDLGRLYDFKPSFGYFAKQLSYPEDATYYQEVDEFFSPNDPAYNYVSKYMKEMKQKKLQELQELYVETFDFNENATLFMTYFKFKDAKERGQILAKLKVLYEMFGLEMAQEELSDFLPLICEFMYEAEWLGDPRAEDSFLILFGVLEDGTYHLLQELEKSNSPYFSLVKGLRETFKACLLREALG